MAASFWDSCCWRKHCASLLNCLSNTHLNRTVCSVILPSLWQKFGFGEFEAILFATILKLPGRRGIFGIYFTFRKFCRKLNNNFLGKTQKSWDFVAISLCCVLQARLVLNTVYSEPYLQKTTTFVWRPANTRLDRIADDATGMAAGIKTSPEAAKKLLDSLQNDLRTLSSESKRKHPEVKEVCGSTLHADCNKWWWQQVNNKHLLHCCSSAAGDATITGTINCSIG